MSMKDYCVEEVYRLTGDKEIFFEKGERVQVNLVGGEKSIGAINYISSCVISIDDEETNNDEEFDFIDVESIDKLED